MKIPKTAGTSVLRSALPREGIRFWNLKDTPRRYRRWLSNITDEELAAYYIFAFVRNPWDRFVSVCTYFEAEIDMVVNGFDAYIGKYEDFKHHSLPAYIHTHLHGNRFADFIGRFENLQEDYNALCRRLGIRDRILPYMNATDHGHYRDELPEQAVEFVEDYYAKDIEVFGYEY
jgi:hypothetical protein